MSRSVTARRMLGLVWNGRERRLRAPFRLAAAAVVILLVGLAVGLAFGAVAGGAGAGVLAAAFGGTPAGVVVLTASALVGAVVVGLSALVVAVAVDRRRVRDYGFRLDRRWWLDFGFGAALGVALMALVFLVGVAAGWVRVVGVLTADGGASPVVPLVAYAVAFAAVSLAEELLVRGLVLTNLAEGLGGLGPLSNRAGTAAAVALTSLLFGALHLGNPSATLVSTAGIALAGVLLALGYVLTGELAVPLGLHLTWNYAQGAVFGFPVSGIEVGVAVVETQATGPAVLTGGPFGPEAGLVGVAAVLLGTAATAWWVRWTGRPLAVQEAVWTPDLRWADRG